MHNFVSASEEVNYIIITSKQIEGPVFEWEKNIKNIIPEARPKELDYNSPEAKEWIELLQPLKATTKPTSITPFASSNLVKLEKDLIYLKVMLKF